MDGDEDDHALLLALAMSRAMAAAEAEEEREMDNDTGDDSHVVSTPSPANHDNAAQPPPPPPVIDLAFPPPLPPSSGLAGLRTSSGGRSSLGSPSRTGASSSGRGPPGSPGSSGAPMSPSRRRVGLGSGGSARGSKEASPARATPPSPFPEPLTPAQKYLAELVSLLTSSEVSTILPTSQGLLSTLTRVLDGVLATARAGDDGDGSLSPVGPTDIHFLCHTVDVLATVLFKQSDVQSLVESGILVPLLQSIIRFAVHVLDFNKPSATHFQSADNIRAIGVLCTIMFGKTPSSGSSVERMQKEYQSAFSRGKTPSLSIAIVDAVLVEPSPTTGKTDDASGPSSPKNPSEFARLFSDLLKTPAGPSTSSSTSSNNASGKSGGSGRSNNLPTPKQGSMSSPLSPLVTSSPRRPATPPAGSVEGSPSMTSTLPPRSLVGDLLRYAMTDVHVPTQVLAQLIVHASHPRGQQVVPAALKFLISLPWDDYSDGLSSHNFRLLALHLLRSLQLLEQSSVPVSLVSEQPAYTLTPDDLNEKSEHFLVSLRLMRKMCKGSKLFPSLQAFFSIRTLHHTTHALGKGSDMVSFLPPVILTAAVKALRDLLLSLPADALKNTSPLPDRQAAVAAPADHTCEGTIWDLAHRTDISLSQLLHFTGDYLPLASRDSTTQAYSFAPETPSANEYVGPLIALLSVRQGTNYSVLTTFFELLTGTYESCVQLGATLYPDTLLSSTPQHLSATQPPPSPVSTSSEWVPPPLFDDDSPDPQQPTPSRSSSIKLLENGIFLCKAIVKMLRDFIAPSNAQLGSLVGSSADVRHLFRLSEILMPPIAHPSLGVLSEFSVALRKFLHAFFASGLIPSNIQSQFLRESLSPKSVSSLSDQKARLETYSLALRLILKRATDQTTQSDELLVQLWDELLEQVSHSEPWDGLAEAHRDVFLLMFHSFPMSVRREYTVKFLEAIPQVSVLNQTVLTICEHLLHHFNQLPPQLISVSRSILKGSLSPSYASSSGIDPDVPSSIHEVVELVTDAGYAALYDSLRTRLSDASDPCHHHLWTMTSQLPMPLSQIERYGDCTDPYQLQKNGLGPDMLASLRMLHVLSSTAGSNSRESLVVSHDAEKATAVLAALSEDTTRSTVLDNLLQIVLDANNQATPPTTPGDFMAFDAAVLTLRKHLREEGSRDSSAALSTRLQSPETLPDTIQGICAAIGSQVGRLRNVFDKELLQTYAVEPTVVHAIGSLIQAGIPHADLRDVMFQLGLPHAGRAFVFEVEALQSTAPDLQDSHSLDIIVERHEGQSTLISLHRNLASLTALLVDTVQLCTRDVLLTISDCLTDTLFPLYRDSVFSSICSLADRVHRVVFKDKSSLPTSDLYQIDGLVNALEAITLAGPRLSDTFTAASNWCLDELAHIENERGRSAHVKKYILRDSVTDLQAKRFRSHNLVTGTLNFLLQNTDNTVVLKALGLIESIAQHNENDSTCMQKVRESVLLLDPPHLDQLVFERLLGIELSCNPEEGEVETLSLPVATPVRDVFVSMIRTLAARTDSNAVPFAEALFESLIRQFEHAFTKWSTSLKPYFVQLHWLARSPGQLRSLLTKITQCLEVAGEGTNDELSDTVLLLLDYVTDMLKACGHEGVPTPALRPTRSKGSPRRAIRLDLPEAPEEESDGPLPLNLGSPSVLEAPQEHTSRAADADDRESAWSDDPSHLVACSFTETGENFTDQHWYYCYTCNLTTSEGCCSVCVQICHAGHDTAYSRKSRFFCDCGAGVGVGENCISLHPQRLPEPKSTATGHAEDSSDAQSGPDDDSGSQRADDDSDDSIRALSAFTGYSAILIKQMIDEGLPQMLVKLVNRYIDQASESGKLALTAAHKVFGPKKLVLKSSMIQSSAYYPSGSFDVKLKASASDREIRNTVVKGYAVRRALSVTKNARGAFATSKVVSIVDLYPLFESSTSSSATVSKLEKGSARVLTDYEVPFSTLGVVFNPENEDFLAIYGLTQCTVLTLGGRGEVVSELHVTVALTDIVDDSGYPARIIDVQWLPFSQTHLVLITTRFVKIFDLSEDAICPVHNYHTLEGRIKDATIAIDPVTSVMSIFALTIEGRIYVKALPKVGGQGECFFTDVLALPGKNLEGEKAGISIHYSHRMRALLLSFEDNRSMAIKLNATMSQVEDNFVFGYSKSSSRSSSSREKEGSRQKLTQLSPYQHFLDVDHPSIPSGGMIACLSRKTNVALAVHISKETVGLQPLKSFASVSSKTIEGICVVASPISKCHPSILVLHDDGTLHRHEVVLQVERPKHGLAHDSKSNKASSSKAPAPTRRRPAPSKLDFPVTFFEKTECVTRHVTFGGDLLQCYSEAVIKSRLNAGDQYVVSPLTSGFTLNVSLPTDNGMSITGVRILVGSAMPESIPDAVTVCGRTVQLKPGTRRWYDIPFTEAEALDCGSKCTLKFIRDADSEAGSGPCVVDSVEVHAVPNSALPAPVSGEGDSKASSSPRPDTPRYTAEQFAAVTGLQTLQTLATAVTLVEPPGNPTPSVPMLQSMANDIPSLVMQEELVALEAPMCGLLGALISDDHLFHKVLDERLLAVVESEIAGSLSSDSDSTTSFPFGTHRFADLVKKIHKVALNRAPTFVTFLESHSSFPQNLCKYFFALYHRRIESFPDIAGIVRQLVDMFFSYSAFLLRKGSGTGYASERSALDAVAPAWHLFKDFLFSEDEVIRTTTSRVMAHILVVPLSSRSHHDNASLKSEHSVSVTSELAGAHPRCEGCGQDCTSGRRWHCDACNVDLCNSCHTTGSAWPSSHTTNHTVTEHGMATSTLSALNSCATSVAGSDIAGIAVSTIASDAATIAVSEGLTTAPSIGYAPSIQASEAVASEAPTMDEENEEDVANLMAQVGAEVPFAPSATVTAPIRLGDLLVKHAVEVCPSIVDLSGALCVPFMQLLFVAIAHGHSVVDAAIEQWKLQFIVPTLLSVLVGSESYDPSSDTARAAAKSLARHPGDHEFQVLCLKLIQLLVGEFGPSGSSVVSAPVPSKHHMLGRSLGSLASRHDEAWQTPTTSVMAGLRTSSGGTANTGANARMVERLFSQLRTKKFPEFLVAILHAVLDSDDGSREMESPDSGGHGDPMALLRSTKSGAPRNFAPFFPETTAVSGSHTPFKDARTLVLNALFKVSLGLQTCDSQMVSSSGSSAPPGSKSVIYGEKWRRMLCTLIHSAGYHTSHKEAKRLLLQICGTTDSYYAVLDSALYIDRFVTVQDIHQDSAGFTGDIPYDNQLRLVTALSSMVEVAAERPLHWQQFCIDHEHSFSFLTDIIFLVSQEATGFVLKLMSTACANEPNEVSDKVVDVSDLFDGSVLPRFIDIFLLDCNTTDVRSDAASLLEGAFSQSSPATQKDVLGIMLSKLPVLASYGRNGSEFTALLAKILSRSRFAADDLVLKLKPVVEAVRSQNELIRNHPNAHIYKELSKLLQFDGYFLENEPCLVCNDPEVPFNEVKLETIRTEVKYTDCMQIYKFNGSYTVRGLILKIRDISPARMVRSINLYYNNKPVSDLAELKNAWTLWKKAKTCHLAPMSTELKVEFPIPITATNFMIEYSSFHDDYNLLAAEKLVCPRCARPVTDKYGVCSFRQCQENAYQCRQCRNINYENLEAFLCNECGYSKWARFDYVFSCKPSFSTDRMENEEDFQRGLSLIEKESANAIRRYEQLIAYKKPIGKLLSLLSDGDVSNDVDNDLAEAFNSQSGSRSTSNGGGVNRKISILATGYGQECHTAFDALSKSIQILLATRRELRRYRDSVRQSSASAPSARSGANKCFGCARTFLHQIIDVLAVLSAIPEARTTLIEAGILDELVSATIHEPSTQTRSRARALITAFITDDREASTHVMDMLEHKIRMCAKYTSSINVSGALHDEMLVLADVLSMDDKIWEDRLRTVMALLFDFVRTESHNSAIANTVIVPLMKIVRSYAVPLPLPESDASTRYTEGAKVSYDAWISNKDGFQDWLTNADRVLYLARKYGSRWLARSRRTKARADVSIASGFRQGLYPSSWLANLLFVESSPELRTEACSLVQVLAEEGRSAKLAIVDLLAALLERCIGSGKHSVEFFSLFEELIEPVFVRSHLVKTGFLKTLSENIGREIQRIVQIEDTNSTDIAQGFVVNKLTQVLELFAGSDRFLGDLRNESLLSEILKSFLAIRGLTIQKSKLTDDSAATLLSLFSKVYGNEEGDKAPKILAWLSALGKQPDQRSQTPLFVLEQIGEIIAPVKPEPEYLMVLNKVSSQEEYIRGQMVKNPYSSKQVGPLMRDVKNQICRTLELTGLLDDDNGMELLVGGQIVKLDLPVVGVFEQVWKQYLVEQSSVNEDTPFTEYPPMVVVYRLQGLDGEATEPLVETLRTDNSDEKDPEVEFAATAVLSTPDGPDDDSTPLDRIMFLLTNIGDYSIHHRLASQAYSFLGYCAKLKANRRHMLGKGLLPHMLSQVRLLLHHDHLNDLVELVLNIIEALVVQANIDGAAGDHGDVGITADTQDDAVSLMRVFIEQLGSSPSPDIQRSVGHILPFMTFGQVDAMHVLLEFFQPCLDLGGHDKNAEALATRFNLFVTVCANIPTDTTGQAFRQFLLDQGVLKTFVSYIQALPPSSDSEDFIEALKRPSVKVVLNLLQGICHAFPPAHVVIRDSEVVPTLHQIENTSAVEDVGALASGLLDNLCERELEDQIDELRNQTRAEKRRLAMAQRDAVLKDLGFTMKPSTTGANGMVTVTAERPSFNLDDIDAEETGHTCVVCQEGYSYKPDDSMGLYAFTKQVVGSGVLCPGGNQGASPTRRDFIGYTTVTHFNFIHYGCHHKASAADVELRPPKTQWEGATIRNAHTKTNIIFPTQGAQIPTQVYGAHVDEYWLNLPAAPQATSTPRGRFRIIVGDIRSALERFATQASFSVDARGGGPDSNMKFLPYMMQMGMYLADQVEGMRSRLASTLLALKSAKNTPDAENFTYLTVLALFVLSPSEWKEVMIPLLQGLIRSSQSQGTDAAFEQVKPLLIFFGLVHKLHDILNRTRDLPPEAEDDDSAGPAGTWHRQIRLNLRFAALDIVQDCSDLLAEYKEEWLVCEDTTELCDVLDILREVLSAASSCDEFVSQALTSS